MLSRLQLPLRHFFLAFSATRPRSGINSASSTRSDSGQHGTVWLVGAGPGDPELISVRGLRLIREAEVLIHDRLVAPALIAASPRGTLKLDVGKRPGQHAVPQAQIETLMIHHARRGKRVVRLKGGDPLTFARGGEELASLRAAGVTVEVVPGITAAAGCAAAAGFPLTQRQLADNLCLITAHHADGQDHTDWASLAADPARTLVFYMGLGQLPRIRAQLLRHGLAADTPAALIENGTTGCQRQRFCQLADIAHVAHAAALRTPCLLVIGQVVAQAPDYPLQLDPAQVGQHAQALL